MNYRRDKNRRRKVLGTVLVGVVVLLVVVGAMARFAPPAGARTGLRAALYPFLTVRAGAGDALTVLFSGLSGPTRLARENQELKEKLEAFTRMRAEYNALRVENRELLELLGRDMSTDVIVAGVLIRPPSSPYDTLVVDVGEDSGVFVGARVYAQGDVTLGRVVEVGNRTARVELYSAPDVETPVFFRESGVAATALGVGGGGMTVRFPEEVAIAENESVVLTSAGTEVVGVVAHIEPNDADVFQTVRIRVPVNFNTLRFVLVERL